MTNQTLPPETSTAHPAQELDGPSSNALSLGSFDLRSLMPSSQCCDQNISRSEQWGSILAGAALVVTGLRRGKFGGALLGLIGGSLIYRGTSGHCYTYQALGIDTSENESDRRVYPGQPRRVGDRNPPLGVSAGRGTKISGMVVVNRSPHDLFQFWRQVENLPGVFSHIKSIEAIDGTHSRWTAEGPLGKNVHWESEIFNERSPEMMSWRSLSGSEVATAGSVHFHQVGDSPATEVKVEINYEPPAGQVGAKIASWLGADPQAMLDEDLQRLKSVMERGV